MPYANERMFTGLVEEMGALASTEGSRLVFRADTVIGDSAVGDSIAVNGCCLTVVDNDDHPPGGDGGDSFVDGCGGHG